MIILHFEPGGEQLVSRHFATSTRDAKRYAHVGISTTALRSGKLQSAPAGFPTEESSETNFQSLGAWRISQI